MPSHEAIGVTDGLGRPAGDRAARHDGADRRSVWAQAVGADTQCEITIREHADDAAGLVADGQEPDAVVAHDAGREERVVRLGKDADVSFHDLPTLHVMLVSRARPRGDG